MVATNPSLEHAQDGTPGQPGAVELISMLRNGALTVETAVATHIARIQEVDEKLNAVVVRRFDAAAAEARAADAAPLNDAARPALHGLPVTIKEQFLLTGTPTTFGFRWRRDHRADRDGPLVAALRAAGAIIVGKTNVSQTMIFHEADNPLYGLTRNPWDLERTPGGSSGGEAAIIAAGGSPLGLGGDLGGSLRIPAHFSGIAALKPTSLRLTRADTPNDINDPPQTLPFQPGPMARDVADLHLAMSVLTEASFGAADTAACPPYPGELPDIRGRRVAIHLDDRVFRSSPAIRRAVREAADHLSAAGATIVEFRPPPLDGAPTLFLGVMAADGGAWLRAGLHGEAPDRRAGGLIQAGSMPAAIRPLVVAFMRITGQRTLAATISMTHPSRGAALDRLHSNVTAYREAYGAAMDAAAADLVLSPPHALPALRHGASEHLHVANAAAFSVLYNVLGWPAGVCPVTAVRVGEESDRPRSRDRAAKAALETERGSAGLPIGVQVAARPWEEALVLSAMSVIESGVRARSGPLRPPATPSVS